MQAITTIGLDIAKSVFQVHGIDTEGKVIVCRQASRCLLLAHLGRVDPPWKCPLTGGKRTPFGAKADEERDNADECPPIPGSLALIMECYQR